MNTGRKERKNGLFWGILALSAIGLSAIGLFVCNNIGGCTVGIYSGSITVRNEETQRPIPDVEVRTYVDFDSFPLISNRAAYSTETDINGQASVKFPRPWNSPLAVNMSFEERNSSLIFFISSQDLGLQKTILQSKPEKIVTGGKGDNISIELNIEEWALF